MIGERERRARVANMRQELLAPITALVGYGELLSEEAARLGLAELAADLGRILDAANDPLGLVNCLLDEASGSAQPSRAEVDAIQAKIRHDLRNPLNAIKGYAELLRRRGEKSTITSMRARRLSDSPSRASRSARSGVHPAGRTPPAGPRSLRARTQVRSTAWSSIWSGPRSRSGRRMRPEESGKILVVDDNASNRDLLFRRLARDGPRVTRAESGRRALVAGPARRCV